MHPHVNTAQPPNSSSNPTTSLMPWFFARRRPTINSTIPVPSWISVLFLYAASIADVEPSNNLDQRHQLREYQAHHQSRQAVHRHSHRPGLERFLFGEAAGHEDMHLMMNLKLKVQTDLGSSSVCCNRQTC